MQLELTPTQRINESHNEFVAMGRRTADALVAQINKAFEIGEWLKAEREGCKHGGWQIQFSSAEGKSVTNYRFEFSYETGKNYIKVADIVKRPIETLPDGIRCITDLFRAADQLPAPDGGTGETSHPPEHLGKATGAAARLLGIVAKWRADSDQWTPKGRSDFKEQLEPVVALYNEL